MLPQKLLALSSFAALLPAAVQASVTCLNVLPGSSIIDGGQVYFVVSNGDGSAPSDLKHPDILS